MKKLLLVALLPLFASAPALADPTTFSAGGAEYAYDTTTRGDVMLISGTNLTTGEKFSLHVRNDHITGNYDGMPVNFRQQASVDTKLASR